ncbi:rhamnulokinase [Prevotella sp. E13-17]|uniref:rhamnulokinase n=1 Tax=Prevotella sp. E13-17 TaxID=2913616 RepID=UPI001EDB5E2C|nr:rhamnulokinase family protein [Prevotella sp. E13-17]UKK50318.1 rhamnulokinase [Prevotella sp. E13-17]
MENEKYFFAVDLGATSGRTIIGKIDNGKIDLEEVTRFPNNLIEQGGHYYWDIHALYFEMIRGLKEVATRHINITSIGIDTWGVDLVCIGEDGAILRNPRAYRDPITFEAMDHYLEHVLPRREVYDVTGIQFMNFNSIFQLYAMQRENNSALKHAEKILFVPDALSWMLTGEMVCEYTIASTSQLLNPRTKELDEKLLHSIGLQRSKFGRMVQPGTVIGTLTEEVQRLTGLGAVPVIAVAGHDTGSAVAAVPAKNEQFAYLSSGTWSLMGIETKDAIISDLSYERNFTNEGGIEGTTRFLKNICGMWLYERCRLEWPEEVRRLSHPELQGSAMQVEAFRSIINPDDAVFAAPSSMIEAIQQYCRKTGQPVPETPAEFCRCIFDSLALRYRQVFTWLQEFTDTDLNTLHIIGGGSLNKYLNQFTANATGATVLAGPQECTAIGNIMLQAKASALVKDIWQMRSIIANSTELVKYEPQDKAVWDKAYEKYLGITAQA